MFAAYATPPILPADAPAAEVEEGHGLAARTAGMLHLSPQAWRALLEETQLMLRSGEAMHSNPNPSPLTLNLTLTLTLP